MSNETDFKALVADFQNNKGGDFESLIRRFQEAGDKGVKKTVDPKQAIENITPEQEALQDVYVEEYLKRACRTESIKPEEAREAAVAIYELAGEPYPGDDRIFVEPSPRAAWDLVCSLCWGDHKLNPAKPDPKKFKENNERILYPEIDGVFDNGFFAYCDYLEQIVGLDMGENYRKFRKTANVNFVWPLDGAVVFCDFPEVLEFVDRRLHCLDGPALRYRDGKELYAIEGIVLPKKVVMAPETQTLEEMTREGDADVQAIRIERYGWLPFLQQIGAETLDERENEVEGTYEVLYKTRFGNKLVATCVTGKIPVMGVPDNITTCVEAQRWLIGNRDDVNLIART